jgi:hypothetical protein
MIAIRTRLDFRLHCALVFMTVGNTVTLLFACHTLENHTINASVAHRPLLE